MSTPEQWAIAAADRLKAQREQFKACLAALRKAGYPENSTFVSAAAEIVDRLDEALKTGAEVYGTDPS